MTITAEALHRAVAAAVKDALDGAELPALLISGDVKPPIIDRQVKIDLTACTTSGGAEQTEHSYGSEIYFYPKDGEQVQDECIRAGEAIAAGLCAGLHVDGFCIPIPDGIHAEVVNGVSAITFSASWLETAQDEEEPMEELIDEQIDEEDNTWQ